MNSMLPFLLMDDGDMDFKSLFLMTNMMNQDCATNTDNQMQTLMPLLLMDNTTDSDSLMMMMMMQSMGDLPVQMQQMMPFLMKDLADNDSLMMMVLMNSMTGGMESQSGFDSNFNLLLPLLLLDDGDDDDSSSYATDATCDGVYVDNGNWTGFLARGENGELGNGTYNGYPYWIDDTLTYAIWADGHSTSDFDWGFNTIDYIGSQYSLGYTSNNNHQHEPNPWSVADWSPGYGSAGNLTVTYAPSGSCVDDSCVELGTCVSVSESSGSNGIDKKMMIMMMAMQSQAPETAMGPNMLLPLMLMDDDSDNENLLFYMMMSQNNACQIQQDRN